ncbi:ATP-binding protein [Micromonospora sp. DR5-3]|uniref:ATP-binding protein n=1 Tax=unclassified Micromonospora TaxID=2617518 RepID=UPI0011D87E99|nr:MULTISPECIES: ATP-binding protein [unclassified Micromonospora]MCW3817980.1 ATP-binding protein [Micromonospora sp. DR5-3]TYC19057.1 ATP-binding protein [Micromonospora sp. MP36]
MVRGLADDASHTPPASSAAAVLLAATISAERVPALRHAVTDAAAAAGLAGEELEDFVLAVHELVTNAVRHGGGSGQLLLCHKAHQLICQVTDHGPGMAAQVPRLPDPGQPGHRGLWLAQHLTAGLTLDNSPDGLTATVAAPITCGPPT